MRFIRAALFSLGVASSPVAAQTCTPFTDVAANDPFCTNIQWMFNRGVTLGCTAPPGQTWYCPAQFVRRDQMAAFMNRLADDVVFQQGGNAFGATAVLGTTDARPLDFVVQEQRAMRMLHVGASASAPASINIAGGHPDNFVSRICSGLGCLIGDPVRGGTVAGGGFGNGSHNRVTDSFGFVGGGSANVAGNDNGDHDDALLAAVVGGSNNTASGEGSFIGGGLGNTAGGIASAVSGGQSNTAPGIAATIPGGFGNRAAGLYSFAAGFNARANADGCFVWADSAGPTIVDCNVPNRFLARAIGGFGLYTNTGLTAGCVLPPGGGMWNCSSSRKVKDGFTPVDPRAILDRVIALPISTWRYRTEVSGATHLGPMSEDFREAFGLGDSPETIGSIDAQGVALAAIQGLNAKVEAQERETAALRADLAELRLQLADSLRTRSAQTAQIAP